MVVLRDPELGKWSAPRTLLRQNIDGVPKVIANKLVVLSTGEWCVRFAPPLHPPLTNSMATALFPC